MTRLRDLTTYQKALMMIMAAMVLIFTVLYIVTVSKVGFMYRDTLLTPGEEDGNTIYSGEIRKLPAKFTVYPDKTVVFQHGRTTYGPYTLIEDPSAAPAAPANLTGIELRLGKSVLFRGGVTQDAVSLRFFNEDGTAAFPFPTILMDGGPGLTPTTREILHLMYGPTLTHRGSFLPWIGGVLLCLLNGLAILFAEELFYWRLSFRVENPYDATPSAWELISRACGYAVLTIVALVLFIRCLS